MFEKLNFRFAVECVVYLEAQVSYIFDYFNALDFLELDLRPIVCDYSDYSRFFLVEGEAILVAPVFYLVDSLLYVGRVCEEHEVVCVRECLEFACLCSVCIKFLEERIDVVVKQRWREDRALRDSSICFICEVFLSEVVLRVC